MHKVSSALPNSTVMVLELQYCLEVLYLQAPQNISFVCTALWSLWQTFRTSYFLDIVLAYTKDISKNVWALPAKDMFTLSLEITCTYSIHYITLQYGPHFFTQCKSLTWLHCQDIWWFSSQISDWHCVINVNISLWLIVSVKGIVKAKERWRQGLLMIRKGCL